MTFLETVRSLGGIHFFVGGIAKSKGSLVSGTRKDGKRFNRTQQGHGQGEWAGAVKYHAQRKMLGQEPLTGGVILVVTFTRPRPKGHYNAHGQVKPKHLNDLPSSAPDWDKLGRSVGDALQGILYANDAQVTTCLVRKRWGNHGALIAACRDTGNWSICATT